MVENNFETARPIQIAEMEGSLKRYGVCAHRGGSGVTYEVRDVVDEPYLDDEDPRAKIPGFETIHLHREPRSFKRGGVPVMFAPTKESQENDYLNDLNNFP